MYANILVEYGAKALDQTFTYIIPDALKDNLKVAKRGGDVSKIAKESYEMQTGHSAITSENALDRRYVDMNKKLKEK